jgi:hypothetical protein
MKLTELGLSLTGPKATATRFKGILIFTAMSIKFKYHRYHPNAKKDQAWRDTCDHK